MGNIYTKMKIFHFKDKVDSLPKSSPKIMPPVHIRIKPTNICNHNCRYCAYRVENLQLGKDMVIKDSIPREKMLEIVDDLKEMGVKAITFSGGGEPLCYPHIKETVEKLTEYNIKFATLTNGSNLVGDVARLFAENAMWVRISMDGWDDESYTKYRGVKSGEHTKIMNNIKNFKNFNGKSILGISIIVDKNNASHIYDMINNVKNAGADSVKVSPCIVSNNGSENNNYHMPIFDVVKEQIKKAKSENDSKFEIFDSYHTQLESFKKDYDWCPYMQVLPVIGADCNIYPCQDKAYNLDEGLIGTIKDKSFKDYWYGDKTNFFKINPIKVCNHHCVANEKNQMILEYLDADKDHLDFV